MSRAIKFNHEAVPAEPTRYSAREWRAITSVESYKQWIRDDGWLREDASPQSVHLHTRAVGSVYLYFASDDSTVELEDSDDMNFARAVAVYDWFVSAFPESSEVGIVRISFGAEGAPKIIDVSAWIMNEMERVMPPEGVYHYAGRTIEIRHTEVQDIDGDRSARTSVSCPSGFSGYPGEADRRRTWRQFTDIKAFISGHGEMRKLSELPEDQFVAAINLLDMTAATFGPGVAAAVIGIQLPHSRLAPTLIDLSREKLAALGVAPPELDMYTINGLDVLVLLSPEKPDQREDRP